jgi:undecaprenyl diphosphate synthase
LHSLEEWLGETSFAVLVLDSNMSSSSSSLRFPNHPRHVAIIMDGNGRWAQARGLPRSEGHRSGVENVERVLELAAEFDLEVLTLFAFSSENWKRPKAEVDALMALLEHFLIEKEPLLHRNRVRLFPIGLLSALPERVQTLLAEVGSRTACYPRVLALALNYGSRMEVIEAVRSCHQAICEGRLSAQDLDWDGFSRYLFTADLPDPDLVIRTSGEHRLSNFLLLQAAYAEIHYSPVSWPDFGREAFRSALEDYSNRQRRFGMTAEQMEGNVGKEGLS